mmetsp:Transcript_8958/g.15568  ORF Transcript_8958/g.15568 Transcript_8958/m.15568 type:complete len:309 (-) Transcript_8958:345-1271(-)
MSQIDIAPASAKERTSSAQNDTDNASVGSTASSKSEERRRRRESWRREHESQLKVDGTFPRRRSVGDEGERKAVSARVVQHLGTKSTAKPHTLPPTVSDDVRVRSNLLRTLGIQKGSNPMAAGSPMVGKGKAIGSHRRIKSAGGETLLPGGDILGNAASSRSLLSNVRLKDELKYDSDEDAEPYPNSYSRFFGGRQQSSASENKPPKNTTNIPQRRRLLFSDEVEVVPIPMRSEYSNRIKERMYSGRVELSENAQRNVVEFEAEGWDATTVLDDENQFYKCPLTGELIHPVHLAYFSKGGGDTKDDQR